MPPRSTTSFTVDPEEHSDVNENGGTRGMVPITEFPSLNVAAGVALVKVSLKNMWTHKDSKHNAKDLEAYLNVDASHTVSLYIGIRALVPDYAKYPSTAEKGHRLCFISWKIGAREAKIISVKGAISILKYRFNELLFTYADQAYKGEITLLDPNLKHVQPWLRFPPYYMKEGVQHTDHPEQNFASTVITGENVRLVEQTIDALAQQVPTQPVVASEMIILLANRFRLQLPDETVTAMQTHREDGLEGLERELIRAQHQSQHLPVDAEEFEIHMEPAVDLGPEGEWPQEDDFTPVTGPTATTIRTSSASSSGGPTAKFATRPLRR